MRSLAGSLNESKFALGLFVILVIITLFVTPSRFSLDNLGTTLGLVAPMILAACAVTPVILAGREGIDISIGPLIGITGVILVKGVILTLGITSAWVVVPVALLIGAAGGALNGLLAVGLRIQPIVATLGTYLVFSGLATWYLPSPVGPAPSWLVTLSEAYSFLPLLAAYGLWAVVKVLPLHGHIMTIGGEDRAAYAAGLNVSLVRFVAYVIGGVFAGIAAISLTALLGSADAQVGPNYTLLSIAAAALGGVSLAGGKGGIAGATLGALDIYLIQNLVTALNASPFFLQITYGSVLVVAVALNSQVIASWITKVRAG